MRVLGKKETRIGTTIETTIITDAGVYSLEDAQKLHAEGKLSYKSLLPGERQSIVRKICKCHSPHIFRENNVDKRRYGTE
jgi:hypothetical protein